MWRRRRSRNRLSVTKIVTKTGGKKRTKTEQTQEKTKKLFAILRLAKGIIVEFFYERIAKPSDFIFQGPPVFNTAHPLLRFLILTYSASLAAICCRFGTRSVFLYWRSGLEARAAGLRDPHLGRDFSKFGLTQFENVWFNWQTHLDRIRKPCREFSSKVSNAGREFLGWRAPWARLLFPAGRKKNMDLSAPG